MQDYGGGGRGLATRVFIGTKSGLNVLLIHLTLIEGCHILVYYILSIIITLIPTGQRCTCIPIVKTDILMQTVELREG